MRRPEEDAPEIHRWKCNTEVATDLWIRRAPDRGGFCFFFLNLFLVAAVRRQIMETRLELVNWGKNQGLNEERTVKVGPLSSVATVANEGPLLVIAG